MPYTAYSDVVCVYIPYPPRDYIELGPNPNSLKRLIVRFDGYEEGAVRADTVSANKQSELMVELGHTAEYWQGIIEVSVSQSVWGAEYYTYAELLELWYNNTVLYYRNIFRNEDLGIDDETPIPVYWRPPISTRWVTGEVGLAEIEFYFLRVLE